MMKKVNVLVLGMVLSMGLSSCLKDKSFDFGAQLEREKPLVKAYAEENFGNPQENKDYGIWFEVLEQGDPDSYEYKFIKDPQDPSREYIEAPEITVNYTLRLLDNTVIETDNTKLPLDGTIFAWQYAFLPKAIDGRGLETPGLMETGLKAGSKIRIVTPSLWAYSNRGSNNGKIQPNTPLAFDIEVLEIKSPEEPEESAN